MRESDMKILLISPPFTRYGGVEGHGGRVAPLNLGYLASYIRRARPAVQIGILDAEALDYDFEQIENVIRQMKPTLVGITTPTPAFFECLEIARRVKKVGQSILTVMGGPHPSSFTKEVVAQADVDLAILMEGEETFLEVTNILIDGGGFDGVLGLAFKDANGEPKVNPPRPLIEDLDTIPFPARDLLPLSRYFPPPTKRVSGGRSANMITTRGCPFQCTYCETKVIWTRLARYRSPKNVVDEIEECVTQYGLKEITFHDDIFPLNGPRTIEICEEILRRKLDITWACMSRVDIISPQKDSSENVLRAMKRAGCNKIAFGTESGSNQLLKIMKKQATVEQAREAFKLCKRLGIRTMASFMLGNIGETEETIRQSISLAKELDPDTAAFYVAVPYPGTDLYAEAKRLGYLREDFDWKDFSIVGGTPTPMNIPGLSPERLRQWQAQALREFYLRPSYVIRKALRIRSFAELRSILSGVKLLGTLSQLAGQLRGRDNFTGQWKRLEDRGFGT